MKVTFKNIQQQVSYAESTVNFWLIVIMNEIQEAVM
jgi:hypothetical protein